MSDDEKKPSYEIGYGKPPQDTRFRPGQSGNPRGKPKGAKNLATIVGNAIREKVDITVKGKRRKVSKLEVAITQLVNKAASGDPKAMAQLLPLIQIIEGRAEEAAGRVPTTNEADHLTVSSIIERFRSSSGEQATPSNPESIEKEHKL